MKNLAWENKLWTDEGVILLCSINFLQIVNCINIISILLQHSYFFKQSFLQILTKVPEKVKKIMKIQLRAERKLWNFHNNVFWQKLLIRNVFIGKLLARSFKFFKISILMGFYDLFLININNKKLFQKYIYIFWSRESQDNFYATAIIIFSAVF